MTTREPRFANEDDAAQYWLLLLRDGDADQKLTAREHLAAIFERRGMPTEAAELLEANAKVRRLMAAAHDRLPLINQRTATKGNQNGAPKPDATERPFSRATIDNRSTFVRGRIGKALSVMFGVLLLGTCTTVTARNDYMWVESYVSRAEANGWHLVYTQRNFVDPSRPWTIVSPPPVALYFFRSDLVKDIDQGIRGGTYLSIHRDWRDQPEIEASEDVAWFDCANNRWTIMQAGQGRPMRQAPEWSPMTTGPSGARTWFDLTCTLGR